MSAPKRDLSVIICTRDRAESLRETLACLARADRSGLQVEILVVDNGSTDYTRAVVDAFTGLPTRYLFEPRQGTYGKSHALNRALDSGELGDLVVVLDDDMSVAPNWWHGVRAISQRHPEADLFSGRSHIVWPADPVPAWANDPCLHGWLFSVKDGRMCDRNLTDGQWFSGNFFWFRLRTVQSGRRFPDTWLTEPHFMLQLVADGFRGVQAPDAEVGHRVQSKLLEPQIALERAALAGRSFAGARLVPFRKSVRNARQAAKHPILAQAYCAATSVLWSFRCWLLHNVGAESPRFAQRLMAVQRHAACQEALRILRTYESYRLFPTTPRHSAIGSAAGLSKSK